MELRLDGRASRQVSMNRTELQQVIVNLIANACNALPAGGTITINASDADRDGVSGICLRFSDTGTGIAEETLARIFDPFFTTRGARGGTGLGLSICRTLIDRQGDSIEAESRLGEGATFTIWLPEAV